MAGRGHAELTGGVEIEEPAAQHPLVDDFQEPRGDALGVERSRPQTATTQRIIDDVYRTGKNRGVQLVLQKSGPASDCGAIDRRGEMANETACNPRFVNYRYLGGGNFPRVQTSDSLFPGRAPDLGGIAQILPVNGGGIVVVPLHRGALSREHRNHEAVA